MEEKDIVVQTGQEEIDEKKLELQREREEFEKEDGIAFIETIKEEDAVLFSLYMISSTNNLFKKIFTSLMGLALIAYVIYIKQFYWMIAIGVLIIVYSLFLYMPLQKVMMKKMYKKKGFKELCIVVKFASKIQYELADDQMLNLLEYKDVVKVVKTNEYIYIHVNNGLIMIIKNSEVDQLDELVDLLKEKYLPLKKYKEK